MAQENELLQTIYQAFNTRDMETVLVVMHPEVEWPRAWEGDTVRGRNAVREYWTHQWATIDPHVEPVGFETETDGRILVTVHQVVRDLEGKLLMDSTVEHVYTIEDGLVKRMEIRMP